MQRGIDLFVPGRLVPRVRGGAYVTTTELLKTALVDVHGFDDPIHIEIRGEKDVKTGFYRGFDVKVIAPPAMRARFREKKPEPEKLVILP